MEIEVGMHVRLKHTAMPNMIVIREDYDEGIFVCGWWTYANFGWEFNSIEVHGNALEEVVSG